MDTAVRKRWTQEEFFAWAETQDTRFEFDGFEPVAMTGGSTKAAVIGANLIGNLHAKLLGSVFRALGPDAGVETANGAVRYPDALVTTRSDLPRDGFVVPGVIVVFEVIGRTRDAEGRDRITKAGEYQAVASIRRYVILESARIELTVRERDGAGEEWRSLPPLKDNDVLHLPEIGIEISVATFYADVEFPGGT